MDAVTLGDDHQPPVEPTIALSALLASRRLVASLEEDRGRPYGALETLLGLRDRDRSVTLAYALLTELAAQ